MLNTYAVITGASRGLGKYIAIELAKRGYNLLLIARSVHDMELLKKDVEEKFAVQVAVLGVDLSVETAIEEVMRYVVANNLSIQVLVNNAGFGLWGAFSELAWNEQRSMIDLNIRSLTRLSFLLLPYLKQQPKAYIMQVASTAAYQSVPTLAVYAATKAYVLSFSRSLYHELKPYGIRVTCICPGPMETGFADRAGMQALAHLTQKYNMSPALVAQKAVKAMFAGKLEIVPGYMNQLQRFADWLLPKRLVEAVAARLYKK